MSIVGLIHDEDGVLQAIVIPDDPKELDDPAFNQPGTKQIRMSKDEYIKTDIAQVLDKAGLTMLEPVPSFGADIKASDLPPDLMLNDGKVTRK